MDFDELQTKLFEWQKKNFPNTLLDEALFGIMEEVGELSHAYLKMEQGIRGDFESLRKEELDAIGDIIIYISHYLSLLGIKLSRVVSEDKYLVSVNPSSAHLQNVEVERSKNLIKIGKFVGRMCATHDDDAILRHAYDSYAHLLTIRNIIICLDRYCYAADVSLIDCINLATKDVLKRDWKLNPLTGKTK